MAQSTQHLYEFGPFRLDIDRRRLLRDGQVVQLTPKCFDILLVLVESGAEVVSKDKLIERVWPDSFVEEGNLTYNISILRKALGERAGEHQYIVTVPQRGYKFAPTVKELMDERDGAEVTEPSRKTLVAGENVTASEQQAVSVPEAVLTRSVDEPFITTVVRHKRALMIAALALVIAVSAISFGLYKLIVGNSSRTSLAEPFRDMKITRLTTTGKATVAAISPDGKYVAHAMGSRTHQSLWLRHIATGSDKEIVPTSPVDYTVDYMTLTFSPDGNFIYFLREEAAEGYNLYRAPVLGGSIQRLVSDIDAGITFSPDGQRIAYIRGYPEHDEARLFIATADGANEQTLLRHPMANLYPRAVTTWGPAWSPDGEVIAFGLRKDEPDGQYWNLMTVRVKDQAEQQITFQKWSSLAQMAWLSNGSAVIVAAAEEASSRSHQIWRVAYPDGDVQRITNDTNDYAGVRLTADSNALVTVQTEQNSNIWVAPSDYPSNATQITTSNHDGGGGISYAPDGRIVYATRARGPSNISIVNADGTGQQPLTVGAGYNVSPSVSPNGRYVVFSSNRSGNRCIWRMDIDGSNPKQLTDGIDARGPDVSPDGKWVVYGDAGSGGQRTLWKVPIDGGDPVQLTTDYSASYASFSPDGKQIVSIVLDHKSTPKRLRIGVISSAGGPPSKLLDLPQPALRQLIRWTSDGRALTYFDPRGGIYNISAKPVEGGLPRQLTNFTAGQILYYAWSRDGKRLAIARGNQNSDVVLIEAIR